MKEYISRTLIYLTATTMLTGYALSDADAGQRSKRTGIVLDYRNGALNIGVNGKYRNLTHDMKSFDHNAKRKAFEIKNKLRNYKPPVRIKFR